jgi:cytoskeleton protein RodZ
LADLAETGGEGLGIGSRLRAARERAGLTVIEAAERLHMEPRMVEALDAERFEVLGAPVYARGHLRRYAELVGETPSELQQLFMASGVSGGLPDLRQVPHRDRAPPGTRNLAVPITAGLVLLAVVGVVAWVVRAARQPAAARGTERTDAGGGGLAVSAPPETTSPALTPAAAVEASAPPRSTAEPASGLGTGTTRGTGMAIGTATATGTAGAAAHAAAAQAAAVPVAAALDVPTNAPGRRPVELQLRFTSDSWTEVYDADGHRLLYALAPANTERTLAGTAPMRVVLGHAPGVEVSIDGRSAPIPEAALRRDVADFVVNTAGRLATDR